ncbi:MAG: GH92 family glycosyl hydrolase [Bacteroidales bacterium]|nr:GH92 family glycosyl hydrolase [Bacteroidales bacterium]
MFRLCSFFLSSLIIFSGCSHSGTKNTANISEIKDPVSYVNPFIGTDAHGHTYPGATLPFGMVQLSPDTRLEGWDGCSGYHYSDSVVFGFSHTHLSGTGVPDYCDILLMPGTGEIYLGNGADDPDKGYASRFSHDDEIAEAGYYRTYLKDYDIAVELTASRRVGFHKYHFSDSNKGHLIIDLQHRDKVLDSWMKVVNDTMVQGFRRSTSWAEDQYIFFTAVFSSPMIEQNLALDESYTGGQEISGTNVKGSFTFDLPDDGNLWVKVGISSVSEEGALKNLRDEIPGWDFEKIRKEAAEVWNKELDKIHIDGASEEQKITFYTALYHAFLAPNLFHDVDGKYRGRDLQIHQTEDFENHTVFSLWDTFRGAHPLFTLVQQEKTIDLIKTMLTQYQQGGRLPVWELAANETECMIGYHSIPVIADAYVKGIDDFDTELALEAMRHSAEMDHFGLEFYKQKGYIPAHEEAESVSKTLEYAYDDWCIAEMAKQLGKENVYQTYIKRAQYWKNMFDPTSGFMRARLKGGWFSPFDPREVNFNYTEANSWQYSFFVPQDVSGLIDFMGGPEKLSERLDALFSAPASTTGREQSDITGLIGQYAHGNEPSHHMAYLYNYVGEPWKTQQRVRQIMDELYNHKPDGLCGNEDCGQMSAWYVLSAMGFYPVTPGLPEYAMGSPLFGKIILNLENGKTFTIEAKNNEAGNPYIQSAILNGNPCKKSYISHADIMAGGNLVLKMGSEPSEDFGAGKENIPVSAITEALIMPVPFIKSGLRIFNDTTTVSLGSMYPDAAIYFTLDGSDPNQQSSVYEKPFVLNHSAEVKAIAVKNGLPESMLLEAAFHKVPAGKSISLGTAYSGQYAAGGDLALIDHVRGPGDFKTGSWQGYHGVDLEAVIDLGSKKLITSVATGFLQDTRAWIFLPLEVQYFISNDGETFTSIGTVKNPVSEKEKEVSTHDFLLNFATKARYIKVIAKNRKVCPEWHVGSGEPAWIFADEIVIR